MNDKFIKQITEFIFVENKLEKSDMIFIPGSGFPQLAEEAAKLYHQGLASYVLPSGKYSILKGEFSGVQQKQELYHGKYATEWEFLKDVLQKNQVPEERILREDQATYTYENAIYSRKVTDYLNMDIKKAILCCKPYHARRSLLYYQLLYPETQFYVYPIQNSDVKKENWYLTEKGIGLVFGEVQKIGEQFVDITKEMVKNIS